LVRAGESEGGVRAGAERVRVGVRVGRRAELHGEQDGERGERGGVTNDEGLEHIL
jgi:hypothetical protein